MMADLEGVSIEVAHPAMHTAKEWAALKALREAHYETVLADRYTPAEIGRFIDKTTRADWDNLNRTNLRGQYGRQRVVTAKREGQPVAFIHGSNNASSERPGLAGWAEKWSKLHLPLSKFEPGRYLRLYEMVGPDELTLDAVGYVLLDQYRPGQPVSDYPWDLEQGLQQRLGRWGLRPARGKNGELEPLEEIHILGEDADPVWQAHYRADHVGFVQDEILDANDPQNVAKIMAIPVHHNTGGAIAPIHSPTI
jgi:hypothetical protein